MEKKISIKDIPQLIGDGRYVVDVMLGDLPHIIEEYEKEYDLDLNPDFQRGHVWTAEQQSAYIEFVLRGGKSGLDFYFNHPHWMGSFEGQMVCVDGLQRITAIRRFFNDEVPVFGGYVASQIDGVRRSMKYNVHVHVNSLPTRKEVLQWYIEFNAGGTPHTKEEIDRVRALMDEEK